MRSFIAAAVSLLAVTASAAPSGEIDERLIKRGVVERNAPCMTDAQAYHVAENFKALINDYSNATATRVLCTSYTDYTDSVNELINGGCTAGPKPLGSATFSGRTAFEAGQGSQPNIPFKILNVWHNCNTVTLRWRSVTPQPGGPIQPEQPVTGIVAIETVKAYGGPEPWLIETTYSEFNSGAWLYDLGIFKPQCPPPAHP